LFKFSSEAGASAFRETRGLKFSELIPRDNDYSHCHENDGRANCQEEDSLRNDRTTTPDGQQLSHPEDWAEILIDDGVGPGIAVPPSARGPASPHRYRNLSEKSLFVMYQRWVE